MDKRRVKIISRVLDAVKLNFPEAAQLIEDCLEQGCSKENISVDEVASKQNISYSLVPNYKAASFHYI